MDSNSVMGQQMQRDIEETARLRAAMNPPKEPASTEPPDEETAKAEEMPEGEDHA